MDTSQNAAISLQQVVDEQQRKLKEQQDYIQALVEEFTNCDDFEDVRIKFRDEIKKFAPTALVNIINLANNAESESVQASLNKWIVEWVMSDKIDATGSELTKLLKGISKQDAQPTT